MDRVIRQLTTEEGISEIFEVFAEFGIFVGFFLVFIEAFIPLLPLFVIVVFNINSYGFIIGFIVSYSGSVLGSYLVFLLIRKVFRDRARRYFDRHKRLSKMRDYLNERGFMFMFIMLALPFTPTSLINVLAGITDISRMAYLYILVLAKFIMIGSMTVVGYDVTGYFESPMRLVLSGLFLVFLYFLSKWYQKYVDKKVTTKQGD